MGRWSRASAALGATPDAEDAFQAVFLLLARRAGSVRSRDSVASWLFGVASRVAARSRVDAARRRKHERQAAAARPTTEAPFSPLLDEPSPPLIKELNRLPERYRAAIVLCYLEGLTRDAAARQLACPVGTVKTHLAWGRPPLQPVIAPGSMRLPIVAR